MNMADRSPSLAPSPATRPATRLAPLAVALLAAGVAGCSGGGGGSTGGEFLEAVKPNGDAFFVDPNQGGSASRIRLVELNWGRLVDVHDVDENGEPSIEPVFRDFVINENVQSDATNYTLDTNPITQQTRLIIKRTKGETPTAGELPFERLLTQATAGLSPILPKNDDGTSPGPFSFMARNACLVLRFDDCLDDSARAVSELAENVKVLTGYPPTQPLSPRILFDPNHGALVGNQFHSTRILIDMTVSATEAAASTTFLPLNTEGLPASLLNNANPNVSVRIPSRVDPASLQPTVLRGLSGGALATTSNGPVRTSLSTQDVVRALRSGSSEDVNNGFLLDLNAPEVVGSWPVALSNVRADPSGVAGFDFLADVAFSSVCQDALRVGDIFQDGSLFLEVREGTVKPTVAGTLSNVAIRSLSDAPLTNPAILARSATLLTTYEVSSPVDAGCWVTFSPEPAIVPSGSVSTSANVVVAFSEPMDPESVTPFETLMILRGDSGFPTILAENIVVGTIAPAADLRSFSFVPIVPFAHERGSFESLNVRLGEVTDLAGNGLAAPLPPVDFTIDPTELDQNNSSLAMRFSDVDEVAPVDLALGSFDDLRGQVFYDFDRGRIRPRDVSFTAYPADRTNPVPSIMVPFPPGIQTPLSPLGSKLQTVWRYCDLGWNATDETKYDIDVYGLSWAPVGGVVTRDFFEQFEIRLAHSRWLPDEDIDGNLLPKHRQSGLRGGQFTGNILEDPLSPQKVVHEKSIGYVIDPIDLTETVTGTPIMPFPMNRQGAGATLKTFTWRNTAALSRAGASGRGVPLDIESGPPLSIVPNGYEGSVWSAGDVPTAGLPLLMEYRCYPSDEGLGLNPLDISLAINSSAIPSFRAYSTGGIDTNGNLVRVEPDLENTANGGFNPGSSPPGKPTRRADDNSFYIGQLDVVVRISRAHTVWMDTGFDSAKFLAPVLIPDPSTFPAGTDVVLDYRGATGFDTASFPMALDWARDSSFIDAYGDVRDFTPRPPPPPAPGEVGVTYVTGNRNWSSSIASIDGARYFQIRFSFINNVESGVSAELSAVGVAYLEQ